MEDRSHDINCLVYNHLLIFLMSPDAILYQQRKSPTNETKGNLNHSINEYHIIPKCVDLPQIIHNNHMDKL